MRILAHRGIWNNTLEQNSMIAFERSFKFGVGIETDLRDFDGEVYISHDPPNGTELHLTQFLELYKSRGDGLPLALNIKSDGLQKILSDNLKKYSVDNYFLFDMSVPDAVGYVKRGLKIFSRQSEFEKEPSLYDEALGVWIDAFNSDWWTISTLVEHLRRNKTVCVVSPELHKRDIGNSWEVLKSAELLPFGERLMICTDLVEEAQEFFNGYY
jgi:glycerophosphoryl diester phosphodiesterase